MDNNEYANKMRAIWPASMHPQITQAMASQLSSAAHVTTNNGVALPPLAEYETAVAAGKAIFGRHTPPQA
ncbi:hypothetical protein [Candidatus Magnetaquicoccus inordinatus]|uniref:hypothetical protein n=1 Tax=Candidatus Magnetaquicoccus inordinatus TaxID=2496818 RepID=UPI00102ADB02|nr:hypothetical protein [Candidatus Magnetaquicoccus inordinatus]